MTGCLKYLGAAVLILVAAESLAARAQAASPRLMIYYVEAPLAKAAKVATALATFASKIRQEDGPDAPAIEVLREAGRPNRMAVVEQWRNLPSATADRWTKALEAAVGGDVQAPIDDRLNDPLTALDFTTAPTGVFQVLMHIDVVPDGTASAKQGLEAQRALVMAAPGALAFEAGSQVGRPNHFAVHEVWKSRADYEAYAASAGGMELRRSFGQYRGAPFDDRFYGR